MGIPESSGVPSKKFDLEQPRPPRKSNILVTQAVAAALPAPGLEPGPVASVSKMLPSEHVQTCQPRPPKRLFKATRRLSFEQDDQKPTPVGNAKAKKCLLCPNLTNAKKMEIRLHLNEIHKIGKAKTCKICSLIFKSQADLQGHGCPLETIVKSPKKSTISVTPAVPVLPEPVPVLPGPASVLPVPAPVLPVTATGLEPVPTPSVSKLLSSQEPSANGNSSTVTVQNFQDDQKPIPVGNAKAKKCLLCPSLSNAKNMEIRLHLKEIHQIPKAKTCQICSLIFKSIADLQSHGCPLGSRVKSPMKSYHF